LSLEGKSLEELQELYLRLGDENPLTGLYLNEKQSAFVGGRQKTKLFVGGNRSGKTTAGVCDDLIQCLDEKWIPAHMRKFKQWQAPCFIRIVTPDYGKTMQAVLEAVRKWVPRQALRKGSWDGGWSEQGKVLSFANGSLIEIMTYEQDLDKFGGTARHRIHYDEEPDGEKGEAIREECVTRLIDFNGDELFTFTPLNGLGWMFDGLWEQKGPEVAHQVWVNDEMVVVQSDMDDNPTLSEEGKAKALAAYPEKVREARKRGDFTHFKGLVYEEFDYGKHVLKERPTINHVRSLDTLVAIDPGIRTTAVSFLAFDADNVALVYDELYLHDQAAIPANAAKAIKAKLKLWRTTADWYYIDPSARNRNLVTGENVQSAFQREDIVCQPGNSEVEAGVWELKRRLESTPTGLLISPHCEKFLWEMRRYRFDDKEDGTFAVLKKDDHLMDATRYACMARTWYAPVVPERLPTQPTFEPNFQPPYREERFENPNTPPLGVNS
jgi:hypothetical protein